MSSIERQGEIPSNNDNLLSPEEQNAISSIERSLREIIPRHIFDKAEEIVSQHFDQGHGQLLVFFRKLSDEKQREVGRLYSKDKDKTTRELGEQFEVSHVTIFNTLEELGVELHTTGMSKGHEIRKLPTQHIADRYDEGDSLTRLGADYEVDRSTIKRRLVKAGVIIRSSAEQSALEAQTMDNLLPSDEILVAQLELGISTSELAENYGVEPSIIKKRLKRAGVKIDS